MIHIDSEGIFLTVLFTIRKSMSCNCVNFSTGANLLLLQPVGINISAIFSDSLIVNFPLQCPLVVFRLQELSMDQQFARNVVVAGNILEFSSV